MINVITCLLATMHPMDTGSIASSHASYDGSMLVLDGEVSLEHGFGKMQAEKAVLTRELQKQEEFPFSCIELADTVHLALSAGAHVDCEKALLDFASMQGVLTSPKNVHYADMINTVPFELLSPHLDLQMEKTKQAYGIKRAHAAHGVHLIYDTVYHLTAEDLDWTHADNHLILKGSPKVQGAGVGTITSQTMDLILKEQKIDQLKTEGPTQLVSHSGHTLKTEGALKIDGDKKLATIEPHATQLLYQEEELSLMADTAQIHYREEDRKLLPERVELEGHIKIFSQDKRGIADMLTYHPETRSCILKALPEQKVLFMRDQDQLCISADEIHINYNPTTQEQEVRGVGQVTMTLSPEEKNLLNQVFHHESSTP